MTSIPFVQSLRTTRDVLRVGDANGAALHIRVEVPERWDVVRIAASPDASVQSVKSAALEELVPGADEHAWVIKLRGFEVLSESRSLAEVGAVNGTIFLLTHRRRRAVK
ncbi:MAG: hypothetical protein H7Z74_11220 [Anaerolineae bacterium]|nr:hypothetical protein [Gemmatimonadaceae bacterium]